MGEAFFQSLKWFFSAAFIIGGIACLMLAETSGTLRPVMIAVFSFGGAYIMSGSWRNLSGRAVVISIAFVLITGLAMRYLPSFARIYLGMDILDVNFFVLWIVSIFVIGLPFMTVVFNIYNK